MRLLWISLLALLPVFSSAQDRKKSNDAYNKGLQLFAQGKQKEAIRSFDLAIASDSANFDAWIKRGFLKSMTGDFEGEMNDYNYVILHAPDHVHAYISRGSAYNRLKQYQKGLDDFNTALKLDPQNQEAYNNRGFAKKAMGDMDGACEDWNKSKKLGNAEAAVILKNNYCK
ncbi:MAG: tetratricopeptide repeat protein [Bacteroidia bacterium]